MSRGALRGTCGGLEYDVTASRPNYGFAAGKFDGRGSFLAGFADKVVYEAVRQGTGGKLKHAMSGGAPISRETQEFLDIALVLIIQGYGMTESTAMCCILPSEMHQSSTVGVPVPSCEIKLVDVQEAGYKATNDPPQGEIWIRGPSVTKGYYKQDKLTKESWTEDGWFMTGDVGQWNKDGTLSVIDRKKNLVKLAGGEYIALERLESLYSSCEYVARIMIHATSHASKPMAVIFPHEHNLLNLASSLGVSGDLGTLVHDQSIRDNVLKSLTGVGKKAGLKPLKTVVSANEELMAAQKLNRKVIEKYKKEINSTTHPEQHSTPTQDPQRSTTPRDSPASSWTEAEIFAEVSEAINKGTIAILDPLTLSSSSSFDSPKPPSPFSFSSFKPPVTSSPKRLLPAAPISEPAKPPLRKARRILQEPATDENVALQERVRDLEAQLEAVRLDAKKAQENTCEYLESIYSTSQYIESIMVHINPYTSQPIAIATANESTITTLALSHNIFGDLNMLVKNGFVRTSVIDSLNARGEQAGLPSSQLLRGLVLSAEPWTPQNGLVRLDRAKIYKTFQTQIAAVDS
ncbi:long-chain fatty acid-CoA ligase [Rhodotorula toruloides]